MEKSGEAREAPVTRPWRDLSWRGIRLLVLAAFAAPIARRARVESARNAPAGPHDHSRAKGRGRQKGCRWSPAPLMRVSAPPL